MKEYKATVKYELNDGKGICERVYYVMAENEDNADLHSMSQWNLDVMAQSSYRALSFECYIEEKT